LSTRLVREIVKITGGGTPSKSKEHFWHGSIPWVSSSDIFDDSVRRINITRFITEEAIKKSATKLVPENSILLVSRVGVGKLAVSTEPICTSQDFTNLTPHKDDVLFLAYYIKSLSHVFESFNQGMAIKGFTKEDVESLNIALPDAASGEQQKIADCLSSLDEVIELEAKRLEALKAHKKGLMQLLFPREGETTPRLRFPKFRGAGPWKVKRLGEVSPAIFDGTHQTPKYTESGIPFFSVENIVSGNKNKFISKEDYLEATKKNKPEKGDILLTRIGKIGFSAIVDWDYEFSVYVTLAVIKKSEQFIPYYLHVYFQSERYQIEIQRRSLPNAVPCKINMDELKKTEVLLPSLPEQQKIADCLSSLDELIELQKKKLEALKAHKKGLMQQLFPQEVG